jgi:hypothetical protein
MLQVGKPFQEKKWVKKQKKTLVMGLLLRISYTAVFSLMPAGNADAVMQQQACLSSYINLGSVLRGTSSVSIQPS